MPNCYSWRDVSSMLCDKHRRLTCQVTNMTGLLKCYPCLWRSPRVLAVVPLDRAQLHVAHLAAHALNTHALPGQSQQSFRCMVQTRNKTIRGNFTVAHAGLNTGNQ